MTTYQTAAFSCDVAVARWWKQEGRALHATEVTVPADCSAHTRLHLLARSKPGQQFLRREAKRLKHLLRADKDNPQLHCALACVLENCELHAEALESVREAIQLQKPDILKNEYQWLEEKIFRQYNASQVQALRTADLTECKSPPEFKEVGRVCASSLSYEDFLSQYAERSVPVIFTGLAHDMVDTPWNLNHIERVAGDCSVTLKKLEQSSVEWARLESAEKSSVKDYIADLPRQSNLPADKQRYLFDWSLPINCPRLAEELKIPKYFASDMLLRTCPGSLYHDSWPSLFVAPQGLRSELHVDAFGSNFWMAVFQGSKRWVLFDKEDVPLLYPRYVSSLDPVFDVNVREPDLAKHTLFSLTRPRECILRPGDVLFVPAGCPHVVYNLETSVAISANFVDQSNLDVVRRELQVHALVDDRAAELYRQLEEDHKLTLLDVEQQHLKRLNDLKNSTDVTSI